MDRNQPRKVCPNYVKYRRGCRDKPKGCQFGGHQFRKDGTQACFRDVRVGNPLSYIFFRERRRTKRR